jgi:hypothetical protein
MLQSLFCKLVRGIALVMDTLAYILTSGMMNSNKGLHSLLASGDEKIYGKKRLTNANKKGLYIYRRRPSVKTSFVIKVHQNTYMTLVSLSLYPLPTQLQHQQGMKMQYGLL